jgi:DAK2 domain fusion protein YloV
MSLYAQALERFRPELDSLNVFPVPDGDTGTNLLHTQRAVVEALSGLDHADSLARVGEAIARASLLGARGNSGVILSQVLRAACDRLPPEGASGPELATAFARAASEARRAVASPKEGTMLSVLDDASTAASEASGGGPAGSEPGDDGAARVAGAALGAARESLLRTPEILPELRAARVVDAGAKGIVLLLDALHAALSGSDLSEPPGPMGPLGPAASANASGGRRDPLDTLEPPEPFEHEVQFLLAATEAAIPALRRDLASAGGSLAVVGGGGLYNVHVHTNDPDRVLQSARRTGDPRDVSVVSLAEQIAGCVNGGAREMQIPSQACALVAVADGSGLSNAFRSLGADVVEGGPGNNPSVGDLLAALEAVPAAAVVLLPNHPTIVPAAERAARASSRDVRVVPSRSVPAGLAAAVAFDPGVEASANEKAAGEAVSRVRSGDVVRAVRDEDTTVGRVEAGDWLGSADGRLVVHVRADDSGAPGRAASLVARTLLGPVSDRFAILEDAEVLTLVVGAGPPDEEVDAVVAALRSGAPHLRVDVVRGGQPTHPYIIGVE